MTYFEYSSSTDLFQSESVLDYSSNSPTPSNPDSCNPRIPSNHNKHPSIQASKQPCLPGSLIASSYTSSTRAPQAATGCQGSGSRI